VLELACSSDAGFLPHVSAMLHSVLAHNPPGQRVRVWLMHAGALPADGCERLRTVVEGGGARLEFLPIPRDMLRGFPTERFHEAAWYKVLLPELLPQLERVLYIDADIIVADSLWPLWQTDLQNQLYGAVTNPLYPYMRNWPKEDLGLDDPRDYINTGVLLLDLKRWRQEDTVAALRDYGAAHPQYTCPEQDAMSALIPRRRVHLHPRWNVQSTVFELPPRRLPFTPREVAEARSNPAVIHYIGPFKPWHYLCKHPLRGLYFEHLRQTPWPLRPLEGRGLFNRVLKPLPLRMQRRLVLIRQGLGNWTGR